MVEHRLFMSPSDVTGAPLAGAYCELSTDGGDNWRLTTAAERQAGVLLNPGQRFVTRIGAPGSWQVVQEFVLGPNGNLGLEFDGKQDFGSVSVSSTPTTEPTPTQFRYVYNACLSLFRDAMPDRNDNGNNPPPAYMYTVMAFGDANVLSEGNSGLSRFDAGRAVNVVSYGPDVGDLYFIKTPADSNRPQESAVFVPSNLDLTQSVPVHLFFSPSTGGKKLPYPYSDGDNSFNAMLHNYLISGGKRFLSQHVASGKSCAFVFPLPSPKTYFSNLQNAASVRKFCLELVYYLRRFRGLSEGLLPNLGTCALSGFSEGGRPLANVIGSSPLGQGFPELEELYLLDVMPPSGSSADIGSYHRLLGLLNGWWASGKGKRKVRFYSQFYPFGISLAVRGQLLRANGGAQEYQANGTTCLYTPGRFWSTISQEELDANSNPGYALDNVHQLMPCMFLQHALKNSGFPDA